MGIRETLNKNPAIATGGTIGIIVLALIIIVWEMHTKGPPTMSNKVFFADNDGADYANYYAYDATKTPPFTDDKHTNAVRCFVYSCKGGKPFVGYLQKYTPELQAQLSNNGPGRPRAGEMREMPGQLVKKPGGDKWFDKVDDADEAQDVMHVKCPDGSTEDLQAVTP